VTSPFRLPAGLILLPVLLCALAGCASISVQPGTESAVMRQPQKIYVSEFSVARGEFNVDRQDAELATFKTELQKVLQVAQVVDLNHRLVPAENAPRRLGSYPQAAWLVTGEFTKVNQGSRFLRAAFGFGLGGTKLETRVYVYDLSEPGHGPFLTFATTGGSNAEPGAITSFATDPMTLAVQIALSGASGFSHGITEDTKRTAREITAELSDVMYRRHWISKDKWIEPKKYGGATNGANMP
jgi:hypothetical protein